MDLPPRQLRITYLLTEEARAPEDLHRLVQGAMGLSERGHRVEALTLFEPPPGPAGLFRRIPDFRPNHIPGSDLLVTQWFTALPASVFSNQGRSVHFLQAFEGDLPEHAPLVHVVEDLYRLPSVTFVTNSSFLSDRLRRRFGFRPLTLPFGLDESCFFPGEPSPPTKSPLRIGLAGAWEESWQDARTGVLASKVARHAGLDLLLVRLSGPEPHAGEREAWGSLPVEWHDASDPGRRAEVLRSLDLFLGCDRGGARPRIGSSLEALACGVPAILSDLPWNRSLTPGSDHALFFVPGDPYSLAECLAALSTMEDLRATVREGGLEAARGQGLTAHLSELERIFQSLVPPGEALSEGGPILPQGLERERRMLEDLRCRIHFDLANASRHAARLGDPAWALRGSEALTRIHPASAGAWQERGRAHCALGQFEEAEPYLRKALGLDPASPSVHEILGRLLLAERRFEEAVSHLRQAIRLGMPGARVNVDLAVALISLDRGEEAQLSLLDALLEEPAHPQASELLQRLQEEAVVREAPESSPRGGRLGRKP